MPYRLDSISLVISVCYFLQFLLVGFALGTLLIRRRENLQLLLISPAIGAATIVLFGLPLSRLGIPTEYYARPLLAVLDAGSIVGLAVRLPHLNARLAAFALPPALVFFGLGLPLALFGVDWIAYANEDVATPLYLASWLTNHGIFTPPSPEVFAWNRDFGSFAWITAVFGGGNRTASGCLVSMLGSATGVTPLTAIMPVIVAGYGSLVFAAGSLVTLRFRRAYAPLLTCSWVAISSAGAYSIYDQNIDQIFGLALLAAACTLLANRSLYLAIDAPRVRRSVIAALALAGLSQFYPEMAVFLGVSWVLCSLRWIVTKRLRIVAWSKATLALAGLTFVALNLSALTPFVVFSYINVHPNWGYYDYLGPSELANMWGFGGIGQPGVGAFIGVGMVAGSVLLAALVVVVAAYARRLFLPALLALLMLCALAYFFAEHVGYGVSKAVMYLQPFAAALLVIAACDASVHLRGGRLGRRSFAWLPLVGILLAAVGNMNGTAFELLRSINQFDTVTASFVGIKGGSRDRLISTLSEQLSHSSANVLVSDAASNVLGRYEGALTPGRPLFFPSRDPVDNLTTDIVYSGFLADPSLIGEARTFIDRRSASFTDAAFPFGHHQRTADFKIDARIPTRDRMTESGAFLVSSGAGTVLNKRHTYGSAPVVVVAGDRLQNHLVFVKSSLGGHGPEDRDAAIRSAEPSYIDPSDVRQWISKRFLLFEVLNPTPRFRLLFSLTVSPARPTDHRIPSPAAYGEDRGTTNPIGNGAAQLYTTPLTSKAIDGQAFVVLDVGREPDGDFVAFARDISLVSEQEYRNRAVPQSVDRFPSDLIHSGAEFSGAYEDGWIAGAARLELRTTAQRSTFFLRGATLGRDLTLLVDVDGKPRLRTHLGSGPFSVRAPMTLARGIHRVLVRATQVTTIPPPDGRKLSLRISGIGFVSSR